MKVIRNLNMIIRPVNDLCNLNCTYCDTKERYSRDTISRSAIKLQTIKKLIGDIKNSGLQRARFTWHGGEPLLLPDSFYQDVFALQKELGTIEYTNTFQTNGTLVDEKRLSFFKRNDVAIGFSLDGHKYSHNAYRFNNQEQFELVLGNIRLAKKLGVRFSVIMVAHEKNIKDAGEICDFIAQLCPPNGFIISPLFLGQGELASLSVKPEQFSEFLRTLYDKLKGEPEIPCNYIYAVEKGIDGGIPKLCFFSGRCANFVSMNGSGDLFSTCHENSRYYLGNINTEPLSEILKKHLAQHESKITPQFSNQTIYREMGRDPSLIYFQGKGCTRRLLNGRDPYFSSYIDLIGHAKLHNAKTSA
ncbi:MAG TPA: hypothetical protein DCL44_07770 [Elusimicrobia bacterium]|nr:hypothetical protein [Elusimicrobiota bacterium]